MAHQVPQNSVWSAMEYQPPRGGCNYKTSILSSCPCLRFMLHPVKAATSFDCDGCGHHASFHSLENKEEDAILQKWSEASNNEESQAITGAGRKRRRIAERAVSEIEVLELLDDDPVSATMAASTRRRAAKPSRKNAPSSVSQTAESVLK